MKNPNKKLNPSNNPKVLQRSFWHKQAQMNIFRYMFHQNTYFSVSEHSASIFISLKNYFDCWQGVDPPPRLWTCPRHIELALFIHWGLLDLVVFENVIFALERNRTLSYQNCKHLPKKTIYVYYKFWATLTVYERLEVFI